MKILVTISRILVGSLFVISGLIKANDTLGFSYKLQEYFAKDVLNLEFLVPYALPIAAFVCIAEIVLGFATLLGGKMKLAAWSLLLMIVFFTFLTFYSAYFHKVTSCGCFGDALKLTPWQSFYKDVVLFVFIIIIFIGRNKVSLNTLSEDRIILPISLVLIALASVLVFDWIFPIIFTFIVLVIAVAIKAAMKSSGSSQWAMAGWVTVITTFFCYYTFAHLPMRDFRPYAVGKNLIEGMKTAQELGKTPPEYAYNYTLKNSKTGEDKVITSIEYINSKIWEDTNWVLQSDKTSEPFMVKEGYEPPIHDFAPMDENGNDVTLSLLDNPDYYFLIVAYDINKSSGDAQKKLTSLYNDATKDGKKVTGLTASSAEQVQEFKFQHQSPVEYLTNDAISLKTMIRSNPGIMLLKKGTVIAMWHYNDLPAYSEIKSRYMK